MEQEKRLAVKIPTAASMVEAGRSTGYALVARGEWPVIRVGGERRVPVAALEAWVKRQGRTKE